MTDHDIAALISQVALGDRSAFAALYGAISPKLFAVCLRILRNRGDAEDALQEVFVRVWQRAGGFAVAGTSPSGWLVTIARNHSIDLVRRRKPVAEEFEDDGRYVDEAPDPERAAVLKSEGGRIDTCMQELESERAEAVKRAYVDGLSYQELADRYGVPLNTMRTWLRRSLLKLRECLDR